MRRMTTAIILLLACACAGGGDPDRVGEPDGGSPASEGATTRTIGTIDRLDPAIDELIPTEAVIEVLAEGFDWAEGPLWIEEGGYLLFSDVPANRIYRWREGEGVSVWLEPSGYTGGAPRGGEPGSNGLLLDGEGRLVLCQHGDRRVARMTPSLSAPEPEFATLVGRYEGGRFNSPNDAVFDRHGALYFTDPPYGLAEGPDDPAREIPFSGVYRLGADGQVTLLTDALSRPNGIALSPDETTLYVANSDPERATWMAYDLTPSGGIGEGRVFYDTTGLVGEANPGLPDGLEVDAAGNLFATGPGGVLLFSADGRHLGTIRTTLPTANVALDGAGETLFMTADSLLLRLRLNPGDSG